MNHGQGVRQSCHTRFRQMKHALASTPSARSAPPIRKPNADVINFNVKHDGCHVPHSSTNTARMYTCAFFSSSLFFNLPCVFFSLSPSLSSFRCHSAPLSFLFHWHCYSGATGADTKQKQQPCIYSKQSVTSPTHKNIVACYCCSTVSIYFLSSLLFSFYIHHRLCIFLNEKHTE